MAAKKRTVVRVVLFERQRSSELMQMLECLRYAGHVAVHKDDGKICVLDIYPPHGIVNSVWADHNSARMQSFGYNAHAAPEWRLTPEVDRPTWNAAEKSASPQTEFGLRCMAPDCELREKVYAIPATWDNDSNQFTANNDEDWNCPECLNQRSRS